MGRSSGARRGSREKSMAHRRARFEKLEKAMLFNLWGRKFYIAVENLGSERWSVIPLTDENKLRIIFGQPVEVLELHFDEMECLNLEPWDLNPYLPTN